MGQDAEGTPTFAVSEDRDGVAVEPVTGWVYSREVAKENYRQDVGALGNDW
jgi:hypothetical protein